jgi:hypothetical protein
LGIRKSYICTFITHGPYWLSSIEPCFDCKKSNVVKSASLTPGDESKSTYNVMVDAVLASPRTRAMYLRRLRTLADLYLATDYIDELAMGYLEVGKHEGHIIEPRCERACEPGPG